MTITKKIELEEKENNWRSNKALILGGFVLTVLAILQIWANNTLVTYGDKFDKIRQLEASVLLENQVLENDIAKLISLGSVATASNLLGLAEAKSIQYLH